VTLIVGINCSDGVVLGADGATTYATMGRPTIRQEVKTKLKIIGGCLVLGVSGPVGLGQRFAGEVESLNIHRTTYRKEHLAMSTLRSVFWRQMEPEYKMAEVAKELLGPVAQQSVLSASLLALPINGVPTLVGCDQQASFEVVKSFTTIGSGQANADPFLAFVRRIFWNNRLPSLVDGIFSTLWTLEQAISTAPGGVAHPIQMITLDKDCNAHEVSDEDLEEHRQAIALAEDALAGFRDPKNKGEIEAPPES